MIPSLGNSSTPLDTAIFYAARGWRVFPVHSVRDDGRCTCRKGAACPVRGKHPRTRRGFKDATTDPKQIEEWFAKWPDSNIGIATGEVSGIVVVDVDRHEGGPDGVAAIQRLQREFGHLPAGPYSETGGGGYHYFFAYPGPTRGRIVNGKPVDGIDVQGDGAFVIAPPSVHASGKSYAWKVSPAELAIPELPPEWLPLLLQGKDVTVKPPETTRIEPVLLGGEGRHTDTHTQETQETHSQETQDSHDVTRGQPQQVGGDRPTDGKDLETQIFKAIEETVPTERGQRFHRMLRFVRRLRFNLGLAETDPGDLLPYVVEWHRQARPNIDPAVSLEDTLAHFLDAWGLASTPDGGLIGLAIAVVDAGGVPIAPDVERWCSRPLVRLDQLCRVLEREKSGGEWFLGAHSEDVQRFLGLGEENPNSAAKSLARYLKRLVTIGRIAVIEKGSFDNRRATTYRYVALEESFPDTDQHRSEQE